MNATLNIMPVDLEKLAAQKLPPLPFQNIGCIADIPGEAARADALKQWTLNAQRREQRAAILKARETLREQRKEAKRKEQAEKREAARKEREAKKAEKIAAAALNRAAKRSAR